MWKLKMKALLIQHGLLKGPPGFWGFAKNKCPKLKKKGENNNSFNRDAIDILEDFHSDGDALVIYVSCLGNNWILDSYCSYICAPIGIDFLHISLLMGVLLYWSWEKIIVVKLLVLEPSKLRYLIDYTVWILTDVHHVLELKKNCISLGTLDSLDYSYSAASEVLRAYNDTSDFILGNLIYGLYICNVFW